MVRIAAYSVVESNIMQGQNSKTSFWGDLWEIAAEAYRALFGQQEQPTPVQVVRPEAKPEAKPISAPAPQATGKTKIKVLDLTKDEEDVSETTPEDVQRDKAVARQNTTLAFQHFKTLDIDKKPNLQTNLIETKNRMIPFKIQSQAQIKYKSAEKRSSLKKLLSLIPIIGDIGADKILNGEWFRDNEVNHFLSLLTLRDKGIFHLDSLTLSHPDFCQRLQSNPRYAKLAETMRQANRILFSVCKDKHWHLVIIEKQPGNPYAISCLDSLGYNDSEVANKAESILKALYAGESNKPSVGKPRFIRVPKQHNLLDCGVSVCYWANEIVVNKGLPPEKEGNCDYSPYRWDIADIFAKAYAAELRKPIVIDDESVETVKSNSVNILDVWKRKHRM